MSKKNPLSYAAAAVATAFAVAAGSFVLTPRHELTREVLAAEGYRDIQTSHNWALWRNDFRCSTASNAIYPTRFNAIAADGRREEGIVCYDRAYETGIAHIKINDTKTVVVKR